MGAIDLLLELLDAQPWSVRCRFALHRRGRELTVPPLGMAVFKK